MPGPVFVSYYSIPVCGTFAALLFVLFGTWTAPKHRSMTAIILLIIGGILAWCTVGVNLGTLSLSDIQRANWTPILATYWGGLLACNIVCFRGKLRRMFRSNLPSQTNRRAISV